MHAVRARAASTERRTEGRCACLQDQIFPAMLQRDREEGVNYQFVEMLCKEERHFAQWRQARPIRNVKRPRTAAERCASAAAACMHCAWGAAGRRPLPLWRLGRPRASCFTHGPAVGH